MKKLLAMLLVMLMLVPAALGETEEEAVETLYWENFSDEPVVNEGRFVMLGKYGLALWVPNDMYRKEDTSYVYNYSNDENTAVCCVTEEEIPQEITTVDELVAALAPRADDGVVSISDVNNIACLTLTTGNGRDGLVIFPQGGKLVAFVFSPMTDEGFASKALVMMSSIQKADSFLELPVNDSLLEGGKTAELDSYGVSIWMPDTMAQAESDTYQYCFTSEDGRQSFIVTYEKKPEQLTTPDDLIAYLALGADDGKVVPAEVGGMYCLTMITGNGENYVILFPGEEEVVGFAFTPMTNPEFVPVALAMMSSIQKVK